MVRTTVHTPRLKGLLFNAGDLDFTFGALRPLRTSWLTVGIHTSIHFRLFLTKFWAVTLRQQKTPLPITRQGAPQSDSIRFLRCIVVPYETGLRLPDVIID